MKKHKYSPKPAPEFSSRSSGGLSHVLYDHGLGVSRLDVVCPRCGSLASAALKHSEAVPPLVSHMHSACIANMWRLQCSKCPYRRTVNGKEQLPRLHFEFDVSGCRVWAWNAEHLEFLRLVCEDEDTEGNPYHALRTYIHGDWLKKRNRRLISKYIRKHFANKELKSDALGRAP